MLYDVWIGLDAGISASFGVVTYIQPYLERTMFRSSSASSSSERDSFKSFPDQSPKSSISSDLLHEEEPAINWGCSQVVSSVPFELTSDSRCAREMVCVNALAFALALDIGYTSTQEHVLRLKDPTLLEVCVYQSGKCGD